MFRKAFIGFVTLIMCITLPGFTSGSPSSRGALDELSVEPSVNQITLKWLAVQGYSYEVENEEEVLFKGESSEFTHNQLESDYMYAYLIREYDAAGQLLDSAAIRVDTLPDPALKRKKRGLDEMQPGLEPPAPENVLNDIEMKSIVKKDRISLDWDDIRGVSTYDIYRNGEKLATLSKSQYDDTRIAPDQEYRYEIKAQAPLDEQTKQLIQQHLREIGYTPTAEEAQNLYSQPYSLIRIVYAANDQLNNPWNRSKRSYSNHAAFQVRYTTFIKEHRAANPLYVSSYVIPNPRGTTQKLKDFWKSIYQFSGDGQDRSFNPLDSNYRTRTDVNVFFSNKEMPRLYMDKPQVSETKGYDRKGNLIATARDSGDGISMSIQERSPSKVKFSVHHESANPLLHLPKNIRPGISYKYSGTIHANGSYQFEGSHDRAPHHEMYIKLPGSYRYLEIMTHINQGFRYLVPVPFAQKTFFKASS